MIHTQIHTQTQQTQQTQQTHKTQLSFVVFVPAWNEVEFYQQLESNPHKRGQLSISADGHVFCDGAQHQKKPWELHRPSSFATAVFILQNDKGAAEWPVKPAFLTELRDAMGIPKGAKIANLPAYERANKKVGWVAATRGGKSK